MKSIGTNQELLDYLLAHNLWVRDSTIQQINILRVEYHINIEITLKLRGTQKQLKLQFVDVSNFYFSSNENTILQEIAFCKFFISEGTVYLSLDPYEEEDIIDSRDTHCVKAPLVNGFISE